MSMFSHQTIPDVVVDYDKQEVLFDGEYFPWAIVEDSVSTQWGDNVVSTINLSLFAGNLKVIRGGQEYVA